MKTYELNKAPGIVEFEPDACLSSHMDLDQSKHREQWHLSLTLDGLVFAGDSVT